MDIKRIFEVKYLSKSFGFGKSEVTAIDEVSFDVLDGEFLAIMGISGSGKTTLLNLLAQISKPSHGQILFNGKDINKFSRRQLKDYRGRDVSYIFQDFKLIDNLTAYENIILPLSIHNMDVDKKPIEKLSIDLGVFDLLDKYPPVLSGGQKQRIAAIRAMVTSPYVILADEPTGALDSASSTELLKKFKYINQKHKTTIIMVTHDALAASFSDRILFIKDGKIFNEINKKDGEVQREYINRIIQASRQIIR